jgi:predicted nucleotidyltransferase
MRIDELKNRLKGICAKQGVIRLDLFGSRARSQGGEGNDYDFIVEFSDAAPTEYSKRFFGLLHALEDELNTPVDLLTDSSLQKESLRKKVSLYER